VRSWTASWSGLFRSPRSPPFRWIRRTNNEN
jgi:hypothetical protein